jgi:hypothetical protein
MRLIVLITIGLFFTAVTFSQEVKKDTVIDYIKAESIGGKLDFEKMIVGYGAEDAKEKAYLYSIALWGGSVKQLGVADIKKITKLWEEIHKKKAKNEIKNAIIYGYNME